MKKNKIVNKIGILVLAVMLSILSSLEQARCLSSTQRTMRTP